MEAASIYVLDSNVFIEAAKRYYAFDIAPPFWDALERHALEGHLLSIDRVKNELDGGKDALTEWASNSFHESFKSTNDEAVIRAYGEIMRWAYEHPHYTDAAKADFAQDHVADAWLVAYAITNKCIVVTHEQLDRNIKRKIPIPILCEAFKVPCIDTFDMLRALGIRLGST